MPALFLTVLIIVLIIVLIKSKERTIRFAKLFLGMEETGDNQGFYSGKLENLMRSVGWKPGYQWCAFFMKMVWVNSLPTKKHREKAKKLMTGSTQLTLKNFQNDNSGLFKVVNRPKKGAMVIWRSKSDKSRGHTGLVKKVRLNGNYKTIEGNSNLGGSPGIITQIEYGANGAPRGLELMAFIIPI